jgi:arsenite methyltransferase
MRTLALLGPQLGLQHGAVGWIASPALNRLHRDVIRAAIDLLDPVPGETVADVGFGGGIGLRMLLTEVGARGAVHGVEVSELSVNRAKLLYRSAIRRGRLHVHQAPVEALPMAAGSVDALLTANTIHHFADLGTAFRSIAEVLKPGGRLVVAFPDPTRQQALPLTSRHRHHPRPLHEVLDALREAGLEPGPVERPFGAVYHLVLATREHPTR